MAELGADDCLFSRTAVYHHLRIGTGVAILRENARRKDGAQEKSHNCQ